MDPSQLGQKVATLEARVATLEDENKIIKGEIKHILTEIRAAILARDNPFDAEHASRGPVPFPGATSIAATPEEPAPRVEPIHIAPEPAPEPEPDEWAPEPYVSEPVKEPVMMAPPPVPAQPPAPHRPDWSLLTIASLSAWAEEGMRRLGALRLEILLDLCEAAAHLTPEARGALSRVTEMEIPAPQEPPSTNETVVILRQLDALLNEEHEDYAPLRMQRR